MSVSENIVVTPYLDIELEFGKNGNKPIKVVGGIFTAGHTYFGMG